ncbi:glycosyl hydrolase family 28 protein [Paenibacillus alkalitolerans]|uniref:glycosyl hydrolase family 28 protein n=1 Tax=Paenibacillus alkalitolerans TaxID=2799335 RepID=UPI0018F3932B|nr:glycosyl hydrolase family 28 protein [Paenibacillus alkalitolerans]
MTSTPNSLITYAAPEGAVGNSDFTVRVRQGHGEWRELFCYNVKVDMHDVRNASMVYFDCAGAVEVEVTKNGGEIGDAAIRPASAGIQGVVNGNRVTFTIDGPRKLSLEVDGDRFHNLHIFANPIEEDAPNPADSGVFVIRSGNHHMEQLQSLISPEISVIYFEPGMHILKQPQLRIPSGVTIYVAGGAVVAGAFVCDRVQDVTIRGRGIVYMSDFEKTTYYRAVEIMFSTNVAIEGLIVVDPPHYTVLIGKSENITIRNIKSFSTRGWSDGIDMMSSAHVDVDDVFLRTSDDCIAIYGSRWDYQGDTRDITVRNSVLWADVAHPMNVGGHGNHDKGDIVENILFENIDVLEHHEPQPYYWGCLSINCGDNNTVRNVTYRNIRIEQFELGQLIDIRVLFNPKYNPCPGFRVENIFFDNIAFNGTCDNPSVIAGFDDSRIVKGVKFRNLRINDRHILSPESGNIRIGEHAYDVSFT